MRTRLHGFVISPNSVGEVCAEVVDVEAGLPEVDIHPVLEGVGLDLDPLLLAAPVPQAGPPSIIFLKNVFKANVNALFI